MRTSSLFAMALAYAAAVQAAPAVAPRASCSSDADCGEGQTCTNVVGIRACVASVETVAESNLEDAKESGDEGRIAYNQQIVDNLEEAGAEEKRDLRARGCSSDADCDEGWTCGSFAGSSVCSQSTKTWAESNLESAQRAGNEHSIEYNQQLVDHLEEGEEEAGAEEKRDLHARGCGSDADCDEGWTCGSFAGSSVCSQSTQTWAESNLESAQRSGNEHSIEYNQQLVDHLEEGEAEEGE